MRSLFLRLFLSFWLVMMLIGTVFALIHVSTPDWAPRRKVGMITRALRSHGSEAIALGRAEGPASVERLHAEMRKELGVRVFVLKDLAPAPGSKTPPKEALALAARAAREGKTLRDASPTRELYAVPLGPAPEVAGYVILGELPRPERLRRWLQPETLPLRLLVLFLVAGLVSYFLARQISRPFGSLRRTTRRLADGDLSARVDPPLVRRHDEAGALGRDFDLMASRLQALLDSQRRLLWDISHELRSPLARLNVALGIARQKARPGEETSPELDRIEKEAERLNELVGQLTTLNLLESGAEHIESAQIDVLGLLEEVVRDSRFEGKVREVDVVLRETAKISVRGSEELLRRALENVVRNAIHATAVGTRVEISLRAEPAGAEPGRDTGMAASPAPHAAKRASVACITVRDHGPGVPEEALSDIFQPFYRVAESRERRTGGSGLGLAICQRSVLLHGGSITARNAEGGGLIVELELPAFDREHGPWPSTGSS
ncbi:MAG: ATP-binding protein [Polyangia bacterium]|jgi:two-component system sensor histidine kinase CpxA|nr:ATP-binding protein [Polyangia bacterium]